MDSCMSGSDELKKLEAEKAAKEKELAGNSWLRLNTNSYIKKNTEN